VIEKQATEEFENKEMQAFELAKFKERLKFIIDSNDAIARDKNVSLTDRLKSEAIMLDALAMLRNAVEASISSSDPYSALKKIVEQSSSHLPPERSSN
jgi:predicted nucleotide-binding protein